MSTRAETPKTILVVDDEPDVVLGTRAVLENDGYHVLEASDGLAALQVLEAQTPDLVILDVVMPRMDGWEALRRIRSDDRWRTVPVVMLTIRNEPDDLARGIDLGCTFYYTKPVTNYDDFRLVIQRVIQSGEPHPDESPDF
jgi:CheY-like chemotaxis protein